MTVQSSIESRTIGARATLAGEGDSLANVTTTMLDDGARCYVTSAHAEFQLHRDSTASPDGTTIVEPIAGPGRWIKQTGGGSITIPFPVDDIDASGIPDGYVVVALGDVAQWAPVPTAFEIAGFGLTGATLVEAGTTVTNPAFSASYNQAATAVTLTDSESNSNVITLPATSFISPHAFTKTVFGASVTFTLHAASALGSDTATAQLIWGENVYYGAVVDPGTYNEAFIESLTPSLRVGVGGNYGFNAGATDSSFFCALTSIGLTINSFLVNGFPFACSRVATGVSVTNAHGVTDAYDVFRSDNVDLGAYTLQVT